METSTMIAGGKAILLGIFGWSMATWGDVNEGFKTVAIIIPVGYTAWKWYTDVQDRKNSKK